MRRIAYFLAVVVLGFVLLASDNLDYGVPKADCVVDRPGYVLGYSEEHEQAAWVMYRLTRLEAVCHQAMRTGDFREDTNVVTLSALPLDYWRSGWDRGHLAPAEDMRFSERAMRDSFYMSNVSPQSAGFNRGVWSRLEAEVRRMACREGAVFVITGPILEGGLRKIGCVNKVSVPRRFYKVVYDESPPVKMIAFIVPNEGSSAPLAGFVTTVDEVERQTGLDFFAGLANEDVLEARSDYDAWRD